MYRFIAKTHFQPMKISCQSILPSILTPIILSRSSSRISIICNTGAKLIDPTEWPPDVMALDMIKGSKYLEEMEPGSRRNQPNGQVFYMNPRNGETSGDDDKVRTSTHRMICSSLKRKFPFGTARFTPRIKEF